jgi:hypothetical protein
MNIWSSTIVMIVGLLAAGTVAGEPLTSRTIISRADSMLRAYIGDSLFAHCTRTGTISYTSRDENWVRRSGVLAGPDSIITDVLVNATVSYAFSMRYELCPDLDTIQGVLEIILDGPAMSLRTPDIRVIPEMVLSNIPCYFISRKNAVEIALKEQGMAGKQLRTRLFYDPRGKRYLWEAGQLAAGIDKEVPSMTVFISAVNGAVINEKDLIPETGFKFRTRAKP